MMHVNNLVVPVVLWGKFAPTHSISCIYLAKDHKTLVTGTEDGQLCVWFFNHETNKIVPKCLMVGHSSTVTCIASASNLHDNLIVTSTEDGELCLWDTIDGKCREVNKLPYIHTNIQSYQMFNCEDIRLFCNGKYPDVVIIDPISLDVLFVLTPRVCSNWISAVHILRPARLTDDVVLGITVSGNIKVWTLVGDECNATEPIYENEHKQLQCLDPLSLKCCSTNPRMLLIVSSKCWQIYDVSTFSLISSAIAPRSERWISGNFIAEDRILVWSNRGKGYLFKLLTNIKVGNTNEDNETNSDSPFIYCILSEFEEKLLPGLPAMTFTEITKNNKKFQYFVRGDFRGKVIIWTIPEVSNSQLDQIKEETVIKPAYSQYSVCNSFDDVWSELLPGPVCILDSFQKSSENNPPVKLTASIYLRELGRLIIGRKDGLIICCSASEVAIFQLLRENKKFKRETPKVHLLRGHSSRVNCFMHPHSVHRRYDESHLLSGSIDASICLWNLFTGILLCKFTVHSGEIKQFLVPPENCTAKTLECVCVMSSDNSVSMINLEEKKCVFLASRHRYPVVEIKWRPFEDFLLIYCSDKSLSIWQIETGHLDRVLKGTEAEEIMKTCEEVINNQTILEMGLANPAVHFFRGLKNRNFSAIKHATQRGLQQLQQLNANQHQEIIVQAKSEASALIVQGLKANRVDSEVQVLFFDIEAIIVELLNEEFMSTKSETQNRGSNTAVPDIDYQKIESLTKSSSPDAHRKITDFLGKVKSKAEDMEKKFKDKDKHGLFTKMKDGVEQFQTKAESLLKQSSQDQSNENHQSKTTRVTMVDLEPNRVMETTLIVLSLLHSWGIDKDLDEICENSIGLLRPKTSVSFGIVSRTGYMSFFLPSWSTACSETAETSIVAVPNSSYEKEEEERANLFSSRIHWELSSTLTTNHLSTMIALSNTLRSLNNASFLHDRRIVRLSAIRNSQNSNINDEFSINNDTQIKQAWSLLSTLHCVLLPDKAHSNLNFKTFKNPQVEILTRRWQHPCIEIREATQSLLLAELNRIGQKGRKTLLDSWSQYLPSYTHLEHSNIKLHPSASKSSINSTGSRRSNQKEHSDYEYDEENEEIRKPCSLSELKRKQTTAVILLGIIGAKFHEEFFPNEISASNTTKSTGNCRRSNASAIDGTGFGLDNNLTRLTAIALSHLLLAPNTPKLPLHTPLRRAAIDLIGRGFHIWEPYLDVSKVLLGLLELCFDFSKIVPFLNCGLPLTSYADSCRTAKNAVNLIANIRPAVFITTMAREIARYNSIQQNSQSSNINASNSVLYKSKTEILHVIEMLIERSQNDIVKLLVETVEIILHCIESSHLKTKSLLDLFPAISKFNQISHCCAIRRIVVGASNGNLVLYDLKQNKSQSIRAHSNAINAAAFSPCGKYLATYSCGENRLGFWQTSSGIFGIGSSHTRCIKTNSTTPFPDASKYPSHKISKLLWINNKTVALLFPNGVESRFQI